MKRLIILIVTISVFVTGCSNATHPPYDYPDNLSVEQSQLSPKNSQSPSPEPTASPEPPKTVSFVGVGDNLIHNSVYSSALKYGNGERYNFLPIYDNVRNIIETADLAYINQETILGGKELTLSSYPMFNSPQELAADMVDVGFDIVSHANNHILDRSERGIKNTIDCWETKPNITLVGVYRDKEDRENIRIVEKNGIRFAVLAYTYGTNGLTLPAQSSYEIPYFDEKIIPEEIRHAKEISDFVIVVMHWGNEDRFTPSDQQKYWAELVAEAGADVIMGGHPHVIQPIEYIGQTLVIYSLGNFISAQNKAINMLGGMISMNFEIDGGNKKIYDVEFIPIVTHYMSRYSNVIIYRLDEYTEQLGQSHGILQHDSKFSFDYMNRLVNQTIDSQYLRN